MNDPKIYKLIGIPDAPFATFNNWGLRITFQPSNADILSVRPYVEYRTGQANDLTFAQSPVANGTITLTNVRFPAIAGPRAIWDTKSNDAFLKVEVQARMPDQTIVTRTATLGRDPVARRRDWTLTPLYDAGRIPGALRYSNDRAASRGGDGWGTRESFFFLTVHNDLIFNDLSLEHGGVFRPHDSHQTGTSIDTRYLGPNGESNPLNRDLTARRQRWQQARNGDPAARIEMVEWIRANRTRMDQLFTDGRVQSILVGDAPWNFNPIVLGTYSDPTVDILDPATNLPIGAWTPANSGTVKPRSFHLDHIHIEMKPTSTANQP